MRETELEFVKMFIVYRDFALEEDQDTIIGPHISHVVNELLHGYFKDRYHNIPLRLPSKYMNFSALKTYINDEVLLYISEENQHLLTYDYQNLFILNK